jgi:iron complex outermembrane receptor protein
MVTGGISILNPKLTDTGIAATNNKDFVGIPDYKSNILAEYHLPNKLTGAFLNFDWQHVGRRAIDDINSEFTPQYNIFDFGVRYNTTIAGRLTTFRVSSNNATDVHYWSTLGPGSITGQPGTSSYLGHLGEPRLLTASIRYAF